MKAYVKIEEISWGWVEVEVEKESEIFQKAEEAYFDGKVDWRSGDWSIKSWETE